MKERIDILLVERRLVESRVKAQWLIKNGFVFVNGIEIKKPGKKIDNLEKYSGVGGVIFPNLTNGSISPSDLQIMYL